MERYFKIETKPNGLLGKNGILYVIAVLVLVFLGAILLFTSGSQYKEASDIGKNVESFQDLSERFVSLAEKKGGVYAFEVLKRATLPPQTDLHLLGHVVGEELYKQEGVEGIQSCTPDFRNACSHTIVIGALAEFGEGALPEIREACQAAPGGVGAYTMCFHGLGHGVFAGYGYELEKTAEFCKKTGTEEYNNREYTECFGGAIMELTGGGGHDPELWEESRDKYLNEPLAPCLAESVPDELREICLIYLTPEIWKEVGISLGNPNPEKYKDAFALCDAIPSSKTELRQSCFGGFGKEFIPLVGSRDIRNVNEYSDEQLKLALSWCQYSEAEDGKRACTSEALASLFWGGENDPNVSLRFCSLISKEDSSAMYEGCYVRLAGAIDSFVEDEGKRSELCSELPNEFKDMCLRSSVEY